MPLQEVRSCCNLEVRKRGDKTAVGGYAAVYDQPTELGPGFLEVVRAGAFRRALADGADVRVLFNHDANLVLGRTAAGTARLTDDAKGLAYEADLPDTQTARDVAAMIARGDVSGASFAFRVKEPGGERLSLLPDGSILRELVDLELYDVSPVTYPAYAGASSGMRSAAGVGDTLEHMASWAAEQRARANALRLRLQLAEAEL